MLIYVPFRFLRAETFKAVLDAVRETHFIPLVDDYDYQWYLQDRWRHNEKFINIEHDVVPTPQQIAEIWDCRHPWCGFDYDVSWGKCLGCTKISPLLMEATPNVWASRPHWSQCDIVLADAARYKVPYHSHGKITHLQFGRITPCR
jgi:hypothetical protein